MRWRVPLLLPVLLILAVLSWTAGASAHPCHDMAMAPEPAAEEPAQPQPPAASMAADTSAEIGISVHAGSDCCGGDRECQIHCAAAIALPAAIQIGHVPGRPLVEPAASAARLGARLRADHDPPRPSV
jgi:hypothetical protein